MKTFRIILLMIILLLASYMHLAGTLAGFSDEFYGDDLALIAKWNFIARGEDDEAGEYYDKGFTFDIFDGKKLSAMDIGGKSFIFTGGGSDVAIAYDVFMELNAILREPLGTGTVAGNTNVDIYLPLIFNIEITQSNPAVDEAPLVFNNGLWFRPKDIDDLEILDENDFFSIFSGGQSFSKGSQDTITIRVNWQWNTSYYISEIDTFSAVDADPTIDNNKFNYYEDAKEVYEYLENDYLSKVQAVSDYLTVHGTPDENGEWGPHDIEGEDPCTLSTEDHLIGYNGKVTVANTAHNAIEESLFMAYDDYDTHAVNLLNAIEFEEEENLTIAFKIFGEQIEPEKEE